MVILRNFEQLKERTRKVLVITNRQQYFMVCTLIDHRNDVNVFKTLQWKHEPQSSGFTYKVLKMLTSFLWSIGVQPMKNCCRFVFYMITLTGLMSIFEEVSRKIARARRRKPNWVTITSFPCLCSHIKHSSRPNSARKIAQLL